MADKVLVNLATGRRRPRARDGGVSRRDGCARAGQGRCDLGDEGRGQARDSGRGGGDGRDGCPPLERLSQQFGDGGGELWLCPICLSARGLDDAEKLPNVEVAGATPPLEWADAGTLVFSY